MPTVQQATNADPYAAFLAHDQATTRQEPSSKCDWLRLLSQSQHKSGVIGERAVLLDDNVVLCILRTYNADNVKRALFKQHMNTGKDWDVIAGIHIPQGFVNQLLFPLPSRTLIMRIWPTLAFNAPGTGVPWSIYSTPTQSETSNEATILEAPEHMNYVDFLLAYVGHKHARIDYTIFIFNRPLLMGQATVRGGRPFFFARILSCKEMVDHGLVPPTSMSWQSLA